ncbi:NHLP family bacteriocin export ABC transporter peptidase/permease/ATPase subunit [Thiorhodococcus minor]|uniref:NHLP family bacteriocin export ABC transporter peptidase/permease/ATPase subunit n=1 Tax=Thiorhodococcus minor TaxID=57489 RepID=A0A6M0K5A5_9GAMM|nr:NHLP family bacteriocin export ABC transporter peptidase/permease/ATPase subunit [Thiorhodococcus minor]
MSVPLWRRSSGRVARTETVLQLEAAECGAASLAMVLSHFGRHVPLEELRALCGVSRDGSKASSILKAARALGLTAKGFKAEPKDLRNLQPPMIAFVNFNHFVVVEGLRGDQIMLNDPAVGRRLLTAESFDAIFTGVVLTFAPGPDFVRGDSRPPLWGALLARTRGFRGAISYVLLASLMLIVPGVLIPVFSRLFVDRVLVQGLHDWLPALLLGMLLTAVARYALSLLQDHHLTRAELLLAVRGSRELFAHILHLPLAFFGARYSGEIADRLRLSDRLAALLTGELAQAALSLVTAIFFLGAMALLSWRVALVVAALSLLNWLVLLLSASRVAEGHQRLGIERGKLLGTGMAGLQDIETFKAAGYEDSFFARWTGLHAQVQGSQQQVGAASILVGAFPSFTASLTTAAVLTIGGLEIMQGGLSVGSLVALQSLAASFAAPMATLSGLGMGIQDVKSHVARIEDVLSQDLEGMPAERPEAAALQALPEGQVRLRGVSFGYLPLEPPMIEGLDLEIPAGASVALVGASGSGKSTIGRLIAGLVRPTAGEILLDETPLIAWPSSLRCAALAFVDQEILLFEGSIRDNLTLWDPTVADSAVVRAAEDAEIHSHIASRPGGYGARVEEAGRNFSGGQRQRLEIARALVGDPRVLVLDEATSALDPVTESRLMENLKRRGCTLIIIAHRLSTIRDCDEILVLERGVPVERGPHEDLIALDGAYKRLIDE